MKLKTLAAGLCLLVLVGCAAKPFSPRLPETVLYTTKEQSTRIQVVLSEELQSQVMQHKPEKGSMKSITYNVSIGQPASRSIADHFRSLFSHVDVGHRPSNLEYDIVVTPQVDDLKFYLDDGSATNKIGFFGVLAIGSKAEFYARVDLSARVYETEGQERQIRVTGESSLNAPMVSMSNGDLEAEVGKAIDKAAKNLAEAVVNCCTPLASPPQDD